MSERASKPIGGAELADRATQLELTQVEAAEDPDFV